MTAQRHLILLAASPHLICNHLYKIRRIVMCPSSCLVIPPYPDGMILQICRVLISHYLFSTSKSNCRKTRFVCSPPLKSVVEIPVAMLIMCWEDTYVRLPNCIFVSPFLQPVIIGFRVRMLAREFMQGVRIFVWLRSGL